jgi:hypothetical protein
MIRDDRQGRRSALRRFLIDIGCALGSAAVMVLWSRLATPLPTDFIVVWSIGTFVGRRLVEPRQPSLPRSPGATDDPHAAPAPR